MKEKINVPVYKKWLAVVLLTVIIIGAIKIFDIDSNNSKGIVSAKDYKRLAYEYAYSQVQETDWDGSVGKAKGYSPKYVNEFKNGDRTEYDVSIHIGKREFRVFGVYQTDDEWTYKGMDW